MRRYLAIRSYVRRLSYDLLRRFGKKRFYSIEQVTQAVQRGKFAGDFMAYAHAAFCTERDFDGHYQSVRHSCSYRDLRRTIARRYLFGQTDFDATTIISRFRPHSNQGEFYESRIGEDYPGH